MKRTAKSTPKSQVMAQLNDCRCIRRLDKAGYIVWYLGGDGPKLLGRGESPAAAWADAARRLKAPK